MARKKFAEIVNAESGRIAKLYHDAEWASSVWSSTRAPSSKLALTTTQVTGLTLSTLQTTGQTRRTNTMARKVTQEAVNAFIAGRTGSFGGNTTVELSPLGEVIVLKLHGNAIARRDKGLWVPLRSAMVAGRATPPKSVSMVYRASV